MTEAPEENKESKEPKAAAAPAPTPPAAAVSVTIPEPDPKKHYFWGIGRRKTSVARVRVRPGTGKFEVNDRPLEEYFKEERDRQDCLAPLRAANVVGKVDVFVTAGGGGPTGQAGAVVLGVARALKLANHEFDGALRAGGYLTRDSRMKERKKYGQRGARRRFQFSKR
jgi:small subunit ribosomal protein S9